MTVRTKDEQKSYLDGFEMCADCIEKYLTDEGKQRIECLLMSVRNAVEIEDIEQQPCEDCISRKQALKETKALIRGDYDPEYIIETLKMLPSVTPKALEQQPCDDAISRQAVLEQARDYGSNTYLIPVNSVKTLLSVKPIRPTSRWSRQTDTYHDYYECENCGIGVGLDDVRNFCPNCGARMLESEEEI